MNDNKFDEFNITVSIIIPIYNSAKYLKKAVESVQNQTYKQCEIILVDDLSSDNSLDIANKMKLTDDRIKIHASKIKLYTPGARNLGINNSTGRFIAFLDSDDMWENKKLEKQVELMLTNSFFFTYTGVQKIDNNDTNLGNLVIPDSLNYKDLLKGNKICCSSVILDRKAIKNIKFRNDIKIVEDYALWLKILRESGSRAFGINEPLTYYRVHNEAKTSNKIVSAFDTWKVLRKSEKLSILQSIIPFFFYAKDGLRKLLIR